MRNKLLSGKKNFFFLALYFSDVLMYMLSIFISSLFFRLDFLDFFYVRFFLFSLLILLVNHSAFKLYQDKRNLFDDNDLMKILYSVMITYFIIIVFILMFDPGDAVLLSMISIALLLTIFTTSISRFALFRIIFFFRKKGYDRKKVLFFGKNSSDLIEKIQENKQLGYDIVKAVANLDELKRYMKKVDIIFVTKENIDDELMDIMIGYDKVHWKIVSSIFNLVIDPVSFDEFKDYPILNVHASRISMSSRIVKRGLDIVLSGIALIILAIPFLIIAIMIKAGSKGPVFFRQERLGRNLKPFMLYKFRTMRKGADKEKSKMSNEVKGLFKMKEDPRVTKLGKFLRRSCIDELPQLINVLKGEMSIVGPRPHLQIELDNFKGWRKARFKVKPGLTGMWQVNGRHHLNFDKAVLYDIYYIKHMSLFLDISIMLKTIPAIIMSRGRY